MLIAGVNDTDESIAEIARFLEKLRPSTAYLGIPTRPPAERWAGPAGERAVTQAHEWLSNRLSRVELLTGHEGVGFGTTGDAEADLLSITSVHPMREEAVRVLLAESGDDWSLVERLVNSGALAEIEYRRERFFLRRFHHANDRSATAPQDRHRP